MPPNDAAPLWVICLCAEWCHICREWRDTFNAEASARPDVRFAWVDIEDESEAMGDVDVETFPTLLIARDETPLFFGALQPSGAQLSRLVASLQASSAPSAAVSAEAGDLLQRLAAVLPKG